LEEEFLNSIHVSANSNKEFIYETFEKYTLSFLSQPYADDDAKIRNLVFQDEQKLVFPFAVAFFMFRGGLH
jgi:hypothetical protein